MARESRPTVDLNADLGESFGVWRLGHDEEMLALVTSANVACGFHAGDPVRMRETVRSAVRQRVRVGAHPGYPDLAGFGRRAMTLTHEEIVAALLYQVGALQAIAAAEGGEVAYVKPHGALYNQAEVDQAVAAAVAEGVRLAGRGRPLPLVGPSGSALEQAAAAAGLTFVPEVFADRAYDTRGRLVPRSRPGAVIREPEEVASRVLDMVLRGEVATVEGTRLSVRAATICFHGDTPEAPTLVRTVRKALEAAGVEVAPFVR
ncbi:MAG: LamB/YcsF family protein [Firmicutes bacterium]|nr:LamB/YcsF family protein [Bacillota bacterium]